MFNPWNFFLGQICFAAIHGATADLGVRSVLRGNLSAFDSPFFHPLTPTTCDLFCPLVGALASLVRSISIAYPPTPKWASRVFSILTPTPYNIGRSVRTFTPTPICKNKQKRNLFVIGYKEKTNNKPYSLFKTK